MGTNFIVIDKRRKLTLEQAENDALRKLGEYLATQGITRIWTFKKGACKCEEQPLGPLEREFSDPVKVLGYDDMILYRTIRCKICGYSYTAVDSPFPQDIIGDLARKVEVVHYRNISTIGLDAVHRLVTRKTGGCEHTTSEVVTDPMEKLRYYYPGQELIPMPDPPVLQGTGW